MIRIRIVALTVLAVLAAITLPPASAAPAGPTSSSLATSVGSLSPAIESERPSKNKAKRKISLKQNSASLNATLKWRSRTSAVLSGTLFDRCSGPRGKAKLFRIVDGPGLDEPQRAKTKKIGKRCGKQEFASGYGSFTEGIETLTLRLCDKRCTTKVYRNPKF